MLRSKPIVVLMILVLVLATVLSGCAGGKAESKAINLILTAEPPTLDPNLAEDSESIEAIQQLFWGLTDYNDETLEVVPELATEWSVSGDGLVWTFKMRNDVEWVFYDPATKKASKQGSVTAHDIVFSVKRTLNPDTASPYAYMDYAIKNAQAVNTGENSDLDSIGVRAVDDYTVEFTLEYPASYFPGIAGLWCNRPVPQQVIEANGDSWVDAGKVWTTGPYMLEAWEHEKQVVMVKNPYNPNEKNVDIERINYHIVKEESTAFSMYENGELDSVAVPTGEIDRVKADPVLSKELYLAPDLCTYYYGFNTTKPPFDNALVRRAFSMAIDRQKLIDDVLKGGQKPAKSFAPPGILGGVAEDESFTGIAFDPEGAKALLAEAGYPNGEGLPEITLMVNTSEGHQKIAEFIQQNWKEVLGVDVKVANQEWAVFLETVHGPDTPQIYRMGWCADYPDQNNWVHENFHALKSQNDPKWDANSPAAQAFMAATDKAAGATDVEERKQLYAEAEKILIADEAIIAPIYYYTIVRVTKPYVQRTFAPMGGEHVDQWKITNQ